ncbi:hypothetical protein OCU04_009753 [Sclerotinia nivalis]|uniref:Histidine kinase domain-containing protein n=1 Tax=Sclerotinia nivalis TaxID=352851 RepID=A0A9X0AFQ6_9HELO|nr:hypothetical protein OCU04_009753 [Sclerotinia nivalis]
MPSRLMLVLETLLHGFQETHVRVGRHLSNGYILNPRLQSINIGSGNKGGPKVLLGDRWCVVSGHEMAFAKSTQEDTHIIHSKSLRSKPAQGRSFDLCGNGYEIPFPFNQDHFPIQKAPGSFSPARAAYAYFTPSPFSFETPFASFFCSKDWSSTALESISEQLLDMTNLISSFTQLSPIAMFIMDAKDGNFLFANEAWTRITGGTVEEHAKLKWLDCLVDEDREFIAEQWHEITVNKRPIRNQGRLKTLWKPTVPDPALFGKNEVYYTWAECNAVPLFNKNGDVEHVVGCLTDITHLKWAARMQERRAKEALTETRQREEFMKMTSHELMNPLSAVVQCADTMISSLDEINKALSATHDNVLHDDNSKSYGEIKTSILRNIEVAKIILGCGEHQKRIIDDARKMTKPDINLFSISPMRAEPIRMVDTAMTMLSGETSKLDISVQLKIDPSMETLDANWLCFDPSRFLQLLLNLLTNANKYTESSETRNVVICLGATTGSPYHKEIGRDIQYIPLRTARNDPTLTDASGKGEIVYLHCSITDTGKGLSEKERRVLFKKLSETFLSTHTQCGDSSLGLLICRELAELQGGAIGIGYVDSQAMGSTFAFYIKTRRSGAFGLDGGDLKPGIKGELPNLKGSVEGIEKEKDKGKDVDVDKDVLFDKEEDVISLWELDVSESEMTSSGEVVDVDAEVGGDRHVKEGED